jgi:hypothetical protein
MYQYATKFSCFYLTSTESNEKIKGDISVLFFLDGKMWLKLIKVICTDSE